MPEQVLLLSQLACCHQSSPSSSPSSSSATAAAAAAAKKASGALKPILTTYPLGYTLPSQLPSHTMPTLLCSDGFRHAQADEGEEEDGSGGESKKQPETADGSKKEAAAAAAATTTTTTTATKLLPSLRLRARVLLHPPSSPVPSLFWAAGFSFSHASALAEVPYDASLKFLFFGEETSMASRYWSHGWSVAVAPACCDLIPPPHCSTAMPRYSHTCLALRVLWRRRRCLREICTR